MAHPVMVGFVAGFGGEAHVALRRAAILLHPACLERERHQGPFKRLERNGLGQTVGERGIDIALCLEPDLDGACRLRAVHYREARLETVALGHLVRHLGADLGRTVDLELGLAQPEAVGGRGGDGQHPPAGQIVRYGEVHLRLAVRVDLEGRVPIADIFEGRAHIERRAAIATRRRALLLEFLPADQPGQQAEIPQVQPIQRIEAGIGIVISAALGDEVEHGGVQHHHRHLDRFVLGVARLGLERQMHLVAGPVGFAVGGGGYRDLLIGVLHDAARIAHAEGRLAEIDLPDLQRLVDARRGDHRRQIEAGQVIGLDRQIEDRGAVLERDDETVEHAIALHRDQRLGAGIGVLDQIVGGIADMVLLAVGDDVDISIGVVVPQHEIAPGHVERQFGGLGPALGVGDGGG